MSLLQEWMEDCVFMNKQKVDDGYGGVITTWTEGATFKAAIVFDSSMEARVAEVQGVTSRYTVTVSRDLNVEAKDVFKRVRDGKLFRAKSDGDDVIAPMSASPEIRNMRQFEAEELVSLPT